MKTAKMTHHAFGLSPDAPSFYPAASFEHGDFAYVYNDGVPGYTLTCEHDVAEVLHGIQDKAIDENFPPTAEEAAEMEAVQAFVEMMATLAFMEEREEESRFHFGSFEKRWEARRAEGLVGKPHPPKGLVQPKDHHLRLAQSVKTLVKTAPVHVHPPKDHGPPKVAIQKNIKNMTGRHLIQQPRKQN